MPCVLARPWRATPNRPLINTAALAKVEAHVGDALEKGARLGCGGRRHALGGTFYEPTVLAEASRDMLIASDETFGPVAACFRFSDEARCCARPTIPRTGCLPTSTVAISAVCGAWSKAWKLAWSGSTKG